MNPDYRDMLSALSAEGAEYLLVGAYALAVHGVPRATGDIDLWVRPDPDNARRVLAALHRFGAPLTNVTESVLSRAHLIRNKKATGRPQDIADAARLESSEPA